MRVLVTGAYGLIGGYVTTRLLESGCEVVGVGRDVAQARWRWPQVRWIEADLARMTTEAWRPLLTGVSAVVNCAGALQDGPRDRLRAVHVDGVLALARACEADGVRRFVQVSAAGVATGRGAFSTTKNEADTALAACDLDWVILRPALVLAPAAFGGSALLRGLAAVPFAIPAIHADAVVQTVSIEDVAEAVARAIRPDSPARVVCDLAAPEETRLRDILVALRGWLGFAHAPVFNLPPTLGAVSGIIADALGWLGWRSALRSAAMGQLAQGVRAQADDAPRLLGLTPRSLSATLARWPSGVQERWFARLYFVRPLILVTLAAFWAASGVIGLVQRETAADLLIQTGMGQDAAMALTVGGGLADLIIAAFISHRRTARTGLIGAVLLSLGYVAGAVVYRPDLWADPLGPMVKTPPAIVLAIAALAMLEDR